MNDWADTFKEQIEKFGKSRVETIEYLIKYLIEEKGARFEELQFIRLIWNDKYFLVWKKAKIAYELKTVCEDDTAQFICEPCELP